MITRDELKRIFKLLRKHEDLLISSYLDNGGVLNETDEDYLAIQALVNSRLLWRPAGNEPVRMARELSGLFERVLRDPRRLTLDADIGGFVISIENNVNRYKEAARSGARDDVSHYLGQVERLVDDLRSSLLNSSGQLWQKINSEFGYVTSLELKIKENETVLNQAKRLNDSLELIKVNEMEELTGNDNQLRRYLHRWLLDSVEVCRKETVDAIHKLNALLFEYRKQQRLGRMVDAFYRRYQINPGYMPLDYTDMGDIPEVFNQVSPVTLVGHANIDDPQQEVFLTDIITGLRKVRAVIEEPEPVLNINVLPDEPAVEQVLPALHSAVENFYLTAVDSDVPISAVDYRPSEDIETDIEIWLYAVIARFNNMGENERTLFNLKFEETVDPVFNGRYRVHDVLVNICLDATSAISVSG
ncbi:MAG: hypothetical protein QNL62_05470 [Gammaproteobacteria bacterium]|nr:hypothetical protein [Gammaproteobacteria bacterium]